MRTSAPDILPIFRSEMQMRLLALLLLQPERSWTLQELAEALDAPASSVHRELGRAEHAGIVRRDSTARPHRFQAAVELGDELAAAGLAGVPGCLHGHSFPGPWTLAAPACARSAGVRAESDLESSPNIIVK